MEDLHPAVQLLLKRIDTHPDEFAHAGGRWDKMIRRFEPYFSTAEHDAIFAAVSRVRLDALHKELMQEMLNPPAKTESAFPYANAPSDYALLAAQQSMPLQGAPPLSPYKVQELYEQMKRHADPEPKGFHRALKGIFS